MSRYPSSHFDCPPPDYAVPEQLDVRAKKVVVGEEMGKRATRLWRLRAQWRRDWRVGRSCLSHNRRVAQQTAERWAENRETAWHAARHEMRPAAATNHDILDQLIRGGQSDVELYKGRHLDGTVFPQVHMAMGPGVWDRLKDDEMSAAIGRHLRGFHLPGAKWSWPPRSSVNEVEVLEALGRTWHDAYPDWAELAFIQRASYERFADIRFVPPNDHALLSRPATEEWPFIRPLYTEFLEGVWRNTQELLANNAITGRVLLYRTQSSSHHDLAPWSPSVFAPDYVPMRPLMSFSTSLDFCKVFSMDSFQRPPYVPADHRPSDHWGMSQGPWIVELLVPVEAIVSTPLTGFGVRHEREVVVAAHDPWPADVLRGREDGWYSMFESFCPEISSSHITEAFPTPTV